MQSPGNSKYLESLRSLFQAGAVRQLIFLMGIAVSVALGIVLYMSIQEPVYQPLDYQLNAQNMGAIVDTLNKANIKYKINDRDGIILVPAEDLETARLKLSSAGVARDDSFTYSFLNQENSLANSQFIERARYLRALENDIAKTINGIEGVVSSRVHIAVPQSNIFADENNKVTASVMLAISASFSTDKEKIRSIMQIVADSVPGLDPRNVAVTDQYGHFLSENIGTDNVYSAAQLSYQNNMQNYYERRVEAMLIPLVGVNKVTVRVNADIDFTQQEDAEEQFDNDKKALRSEQTEDDQDSSGSGSGGTPGALSNSPPGGSGTTSSGGASQRRSQSTRNYDVTKSVTYKKSNYAKLKSLSVAVAIDNEMIFDPKTKEYVARSLDQDKINKITELVKATIGYDQARGDKVTVINSSYTVSKQDNVVVKTRLWEQPWFWDMAKKIIGILLGFIFLFILYRRLIRYMGSVPGSPRMVPVNKQQVANAARMQAEEAAEEEAAKQRRMHEYKEEGMTKLKHMASTEPQQVAMIIKSWVGKQ